MSLCALSLLFFSPFFFSGRGGQKIREIEDESGARVKVHVHTHTYEIFRVNYNYLLLD